MPDLIPLADIDGAKVDDLLDAAFGGDRHSRTAYLLRTRQRLVAKLSFACLDGDMLVGAIQCWPVRIGETPLVLVGPVAVHPNRQDEGVGTRLMHAMLEAAAEIGDPPMVMIGDAEYYGRFGFDAAATGGWMLPGPWEPHRLLARNPRGMKLPFDGLLREDCDAL